MANLGGLDLTNKVFSEMGYSDRISATNKEALENLSLLAPEEVTEFIGVLGKIVKQYLFSTMYDRADNIFSGFFQEMLPFGMSIEDLYVDIISGTDPAWEDDGSVALSRKKPNVSAIYHTINYEKQYKVSTSYAQAKNAFMSLEGIDNLASRILNTLNTSCEYDIYLNCCELLSTAYEQGVFTDIVVDGLDTESNIKSTLKTIKTTLKDMKFMTNKYNPMGIVTKTDENNLVLMLPVDHSATIDVDLLSGVFNLDKMRLEGRIIDIQKDTGFGTLMETSNTIALAIDQRMLRIFPTLFESSSIYNPSGLFTNTFLTAQFIFSYGTFFNAIRFTTEESEV